MMFMISYVPGTKSDSSMEQFNTTVSTTLRNIGTIDVWANQMSQNGVWIVSSRLNASQIRDAIKPYVAQNDRVFVARISRNWAGMNMGQAFAEWMPKQEFGTFNNN